MAAGYSFSLFLIHFSLLILIMPLSPLPRSATFVVAVLVANVAAYGFARVTENRHKHLAAWLRQAICPDSGVGMTRILSRLFICSHHGHLWCTAQDYDAVLSQDCARCSAARLVPTVQAGDGRPGELVRITGPRSAGGLS